MLKIYETVMVIKPTLDDDQVKELIIAVKGLLEKNNAHIICEEDWGKKRLAYEIQKFKKAFYYQLNFEANPELLQKLERYYRLSEDVLCFMTVLLQSKALKAFRKGLKKKETAAEEENDGRKSE